MLIAALGSAAAEDERPFHTHKSTTVKAGPTYIVEGRKRIPPGCRLSVQQGVRIVGRGENPVIEVAGALHLHGVEGKPISVEGVRIELAPKFEVLRLDHAQLTGCGGIFTAKDAPAKGRLQIENTAFHGGVMLDVAFTGGECDLLNSGFGSEVRIRGVPQGKKKISTVTVKLVGCGGPKHGPNGFQKGVFLTGLKRPVVRNCVLGGEASTFVDCKALMFDGNKSSSFTLTFRNSDAALFKGMKLLKNDMFSRAVVFSAPARKQRVMVLADKCWWRGVTSKRIVEDMITDGRDDPKVGVAVKLGKISEKEHGLGGSALPR